MGASEAAVAALLLVALTVVAIQAPHPEDADPDPVARAMAYLATYPSPESVEAAVAAGLDPTAWPGPGMTTNIRVPPNDPARPVEPLRELHALLLAGAGPVFDDPVRGPVDLRAQLRGDHAAVLQARAGSHLCFWLLAADAAGWGADDPDVAAALDALASQQGAAGDFACVPGSVGIECTCFAVAALAAHGALDRIDGDATLRYVQAGMDPAVPGAYGDGDGSNAQTTAWAVTCLRHLGAPGADVEQAVDWLADLQRPDGGFPRAPGGDSDPWATAEVVVALRGGHPIA